MLLFVVVVLLLLVLVLVLVVAVAIDVVSAIIAVVAAAKLCSSMSRCFLRC